MEDITKIFFTPGDIVRVKHRELDYRPNMWVVEKVSRTYKHNNETINSFLGIKCRWFNKQGDLREEIFSSKDLEHVKR